MPEDKTAVDMLYQDFNKMARRLGDMDSNLQRLNRVAKLDAFDKAQDTQALTMHAVQTMAANTRATTELAGVINEALLPEVMVDKAGNEVSRYHRLQRMRQTQHGVAYNRRLAACKQTITPVCSCGKHHGIQFIENDVVIDELCPQHWWLKLSRLAYEDHRLGAFMKEKPLSAYLQIFTL